MKVILFNGSPNKNGCTYTALNECAKTFAECGIETEFFQLGTEPQHGCIGCHACRGTGRCALGGGVNEFLDLAKTADGFIFGSPVYYAGANGAATAFLDRVFFAGSAQMRLKPGAAVASARRAGTTATLDRLNKYFLISQMPVISSSYWNMVHGNTPEEVMQDAEGLQTMRTLARNMAWFLKCKQAGEQMGIEPPTPEPRIFTNFVR